MAYDEELAGRIRELINADYLTDEKKMFGGLGFMIGGNLAVAAGSHGDLMVRVDPAQSAELVATTPAEPMTMGNRSMRGWLRIDAEQLRSDSELSRWVDRGARYTAALPAKAGSAR